MKKRLGDTRVCIVLAAFGVSMPEGVLGITEVLEAVRRAYPETPIRLAFTSNQIRGRWRQRAADPSWRRENPSVPEDFYEVQGPLAAMASLQDVGCRELIVQPLHICAGEEYQDLESYVKGLISIKTIKPKWQPFSKISLGRPALGRPGPKHPYDKDLMRAARALSPDLELAREMDAALVYVGHGNHFMPSGIYRDFERIMSRGNPEPSVSVGMVEGMWDLEYVLERLESAGAKKVLLKPLMLVAGEHARQDICGNDSDSWKSALEAKNYQVQCMLEGLGQNPAWVRIYLENLQDAARDVGLDF
jgi:sirohydrochlorin cobaltochelatase